MASRTLVIKTKMDNKDFHAQIRSMESDLERLKGDYEAIANGPTYSNQQQDLQDLEKEIEKATNKLNDFKRKQEEIDNQGKFNLGGAIENVNKSLTGTIKKVGRLAVAFFGIRSILGMISRSTSIVTENNEELANKIDAIKNTVAMSLEPVITRIVNLIQTLLQYVGYLIKAWTGKNIFASAKNNMKATAKSAKEVKKTLAGFDEMNTVSDNSSGSSSGGAGTIEALPEGQIPEWLQWIADNGGLIASILAGIATGVVAIQLGAKGIKALGIGLMVAGIISLVQNVIDLINDPSWENFGKVLTSIGTIILGLGLLIGNVPLIVAGVITLIVGYVITHWEQIKELFKNGIEFIKEKINSFKTWINDGFIKKMTELFGSLGTVVGTIIAGLANTVLGFFGNILSGAKKIVSGIINIFKGNFITGIKQVFSGLKSIMLSPINAVIDGINTLIKGINKIKFNVPDWVPGIGGKKWGFDLPSIPKLAKGGIVNNPGRGVNMGSYIAGERGPEAVLPLNTKTFDNLGTAIAKHITINATIENKMNGRTISRELAKINNSSNFASNS